jgi:PiT family inorganic phosphate transporter
MDSALLAFAVLLLAYTNGANDNFKGVATLYGGGVLGYRSAIALATVMTFLGSLAGLYFGSALLATFSGKGLVPDSIAADPRFLANVGLAAGATVLLATRLGFPVSTTHALVGALLGAGFVASRSELNVTRLGSVFFAPLLGSPILAIALAGGQQLGFSALRRSLRLEKEPCLCVGEEMLVTSIGGGVAAAMPVKTIAFGTTDACEARFGSSAGAVTSGGLANALHCLSASAVSFARGVNDTPKIVALLLATKLLAPASGIFLVGVAIAVGGVVGARRVAETMSHRITAMNTGTALTANLTTAFLVLFASRLGLPVSTTHVSCGSLFGIGAVNGQARWRTIGQILMAWMVTLPIAAVFAIALATL